LSSKNKNPFTRDKERRERQKARKYTRRNRRQRKPRRNNWIDLAHEDWEDLPDEWADERIMPRDENERRAVIASKAAKSGVEVEDAEAFEEAEAAGLIGRVLEVSSGVCLVRVDGRDLLCQMRAGVMDYESGYTNAVAVGDRVALTETDRLNGQARGMIEEILPRTSRISRSDPLKGDVQQILIANADRLIAVASWRDPHFWPELVDRYLITAERSEVEPLLCINKIDLAAERAEVEDVARIYREAGYEVLLTSAETGDGIDELREALRGRVTALAGLSGVGKSSLLRAVEPGFELRTGAVNTGSHQGRHTTTLATMLPFGADGYVIDTPGIREFGLAGLDPADLIAFYPDLAGHAVRCQYADCSHIHEPGCAVQAAIENGTASAMRYESYLKIREDLV
jgi:ribosome biogenesis GTPase